MTNEEIDNCLKSWVRISNSLSEINTGDLQMLVQAAKEAPEAIERLVERSKERELMSDILINIFESLKRIESKIGA